MLNLSHHGSPVNRIQSKHRILLRLSIAKRAHINHPPVIGRQSDHAEHMARLDRLCENLTCPTCNDPATLPAGTPRRDLTSPGPAARPSRKRATTCAPDTSG